jgi:hypothetical protein
VTTLAAVPSVPDVLADRAALARMPADALIELRRQIAQLGADVEAALDRHRLQPNAHPRPVNAAAGRLLSPTEAAVACGVTKRWLLEHADEIPGVRRLSRKIIRFDERALRRHLNGMKG